MSRHVTQFGSTVNIPDDLVDGYRRAGFLAPEETDDDGGAPKGNASREEWAAYADSLGVEYDEDAKRDDIKAAVEAAGTDDD